MDKLALLVTLQAKPGKEKEVEEFLKGGLALVEEEPKTNHWFALKMENMESSTPLMMNQGETRTLMEKWQKH